MAGEGDLDEIRPWASVTKMAVAFAAARLYERDQAVLERPAGPEGATIAHLLSHSSGLGLEANDVVRDVGSRRIYSNVGIDLAASFLAPRGDVAAWIDAEVTSPLNLTHCQFTGRASSGLSGSLADLSALGRAWLSTRELSATTIATFTTSYLADLAGVVPGFGRFDPCPWGLGPEVHGTKAHWMGSLWSAQSFGHFGQSGSYLLIDPTRDLVIAALAGASFGPWAATRWPTWADENWEQWA